MPIRSKSRNHYKLQITESSHRIRELQLEVTLLNSSLSASEQENKRLLDLVAVEADLREEDGRKLRDCVEALKNAASKESSDLIDQLQQLQLEKNLVANELEMKKESLHKLELHMLNESSRSEKKLALQVFEIFSFRFPPFHYLSCHFGYLDEAKRNPTARYGQPASGKEVFRK